MKVPGLFNLTLESSDSGKGTRHWSHCATFGTLIAEVDGSELWLFILSSYLTRERAKAGSTRMLCSSYSAAEGTGFRQYCTEMIRFSFLHLYVYAS